MALNYPYNQGTINTFPNQPFFPQSQGNVYLINSSNEVANVPVGAGVSIAWCAKEGIMYVKTMQNGNPMMVSYRLTSLDSSQPQNTNNNNLQDYAARLSKLEAAVFKEKKEGGKLEWEV